MDSYGHKELSRRKHRGSSPLSDEDAERSSKKHKYRHHRRHRKKRENQAETKNEPDEGEDSSPPLVPPRRISSHQNRRPDDDVEEGEILEEDGIDEFERKSREKYDEREKSIDRDHRKRSKREASILEEDVIGEFKRNSRDKSDERERSIDRDYRKRSKREASILGEDGIGEFKRNSRGKYDEQERSIDRDYRKRSKREGSILEEDGSDEFKRKGRDKYDERERSIDRDYRKRSKREGSILEEDRIDEFKRKSRDKYDEREKSIDRDYRRRSKREGSIDWEWERDNRRSSRRERSRERESGIDRRMEKRRETSRDRTWEREKVRDRDNDRDRRLEEDRLDDRNKYRTMGVLSWKSNYENCEYEQDKRRDSKYSRFTETDKRKREDSSKSEVLDSDYEYKRDENEQDDFEEAFVLKPAEQEEDDLNRIKEESRRLRQAIMEKYRNQQQQQQAKPQPEDEVKEKEPLVKPSEELALPGAVEILGGRTEGGNGDVAETPISVGKSIPQNVIARSTVASGLGEGTPKSERSDDMFCGDIFGDSPAGRPKSAKGGGLPIERSGLHDNWDDAEGYYSYRFGEILDGRYEVIAAHGKGVFSAVVRAKDLKAGPGDPEEVAIKILRNKEAMYKAGVEELGILNKLVGADPEDKRHCVRLYSSFKYRNHLCLVFESLNMNLREVLKKFGRNIGLKLTAVRAYAKQLFIALKHLRNCGVLHCDIKPDNMLVNEAKNVLKLCDFGNAMFAGKNEITPYLVSRFYRAPEIILGLPYDHPIDIWSVGCCLYELYTGKVLFPGPTNNDMLRLHMELKGPFPKKLLRKGAFTDRHFDQDLNFLSTEEDPVTKKTIKRVIVNVRPKDIGSIIKGSAGEDPKMLANFKDLLDKIFVVDPEKRMTVQQVLSHPFIMSK